MTNFFYKFYKVIFVCLILATAALYKGKILNYDLFTQEKETGKIVAKFTLEDVKQIFPTATRFVDENKGSALVYADNEQIGQIINSSPISDSIVGFSAAVPLLIGVDNKKQINGVVLLKNDESADFIKKVVQSGLLDSWNNIPANKVTNKHIDAVSGATLSSNAIIKTMNHRLGQYVKQPVQENISGSGYIEYIKTGLGVLLLVLGLIQFFYTKQFKKFRPYFQVAIVVVLGFWLGLFISTMSLLNWTVYGFQLPSKLLLLIIVCAAILLPLFTGKSFYCAHLCPYGAAQDLFGKIWSSHIKISPKWRIFLSTLREKIFASIVLLLITGVSFDLTNVEPFSAFLFETASTPIIILAITFLILAVITPRPWCNYFCPTGQFLEIIRKPIKKNHHEN